MSETNLDRGAARPEYLAERVSWTPRNPIFRRVVVALLLLLGLVCSLRFGAVGPVTPSPLVVAAVLALVFGMSLVLPRDVDLLAQVRSPSRRAANWTAVGIALGAVLLLYVFASGRPFVPTFHDEHAHVIQMQMLARGRLWMPAHPLADFFETFHVFVKPVYAAMYFPGASLLYAPAIWLQLPLWLMPLLVSAAVVGLTYRVLTELVDGAAGWLGALALVAVEPLRFVSIMVLSHQVMMLWGLASVWAWLRWRRERTRSWAVLLGVFLGWAAITRPLDALCYALPLGVGVLLDLRRSGMRHRAVALGLMACGMAPFLALQLVANYGITGHMLRSPYDEYAARNYPGIALGVGRFDPALAPDSALPQKRAYYDHVIVPVLKAHARFSLWTQFMSYRLPVLFQSDLPDTILLVLLPVGILGFTDQRRALVGALLPIFLGAYVLFSSFLPYYGLPAALPLLLTLVLGVRACAEAWPRPRAVETALAFLVAWLIVGSMPVVGWMEDYRAPWPIMIAAHREVPRQVEAPAVVLFPFHRGDNFHEEPVYNIDVAWPDDAPIVRAQDLGPARNEAIAAYYAATQPDRKFYRFDRGTLAAEPLGTARDFLETLRRASGKSG